VLSRRNEKADKAVSEAVQTNRKILRGFWRRSRRGARGQRPIAGPIESACIVLGATLVYLALSEFAVRIALHVPLLEWRDFRHERAAATINTAVQYDSLLGWRLKPFITRPGFNTLEYGFRSNGGADATARPGGVLAVGSSFTAGSGVTDSETWPAQLQQLTGWDVTNAGEGGYQADQIILLGEQLLPLVRPRALVVDLIPGTIIGTGYASAGWPKPYFTIENCALVAHNSPVPPSQNSRRARFDVKQFLGHSAALDHFMAAFFADFWFTTDGNSFVPIRTDEVEVTCRLLARLKQKSDAAGVRLVLYLQHLGLEVVDGSRMAAESHMTAKAGFYRLRRWLITRLKPFLFNTPPGAPDWREASDRVGECARGLNITVADELAALTAVYEQNPDDLRKYYQIELGGVMGHKTTFGNMDVAKRVAAAIGDLGSPSDQKSK
jgi:hypothetical protein